MEATLDFFMVLGRLAAKNRSPLEQDLELSREEQKIADTVRSIATQINPATIFW